MEEEDDWNGVVCENLVKFGVNKATAVVVDGTNVCLRRQKVLVCYFNSGIRTEILDYSEMPPKITEGPTMRIPRIFATFLTLPNGNIAVFGGKLYDKYTTTSSCEVFKPDRSAFFSMKNMGKPRELMAAVVLSNGVVFICGGRNENTYLDCCEFYNPRTGNFSPSKARLRHARICHTASLLQNGKVLIAGGSINNMDALQSEIYDAESDSFSAGPYMLSERGFDVAITLRDGRVFISGGKRHTTELYDPATELFTEGPRKCMDGRHSLSYMLPDGRVLIVDCNNSSYQEKIASEIYDPITNTISRGPDMTHSYKLYATAF
jgi:hypothetical protein